MLLDCRRVNRYHTMFTCCLCTYCMHLAVLNRLSKIKMPITVFTPKLLQCSTQFNVGMQSTQVDEACDDDILQQFSSSSYTSHTSSKLTEPCLLLLKNASDLLFRKLYKQRSVQQPAA